MRGEAADQNEARAEALQRDRDAVQPPRRRRTMPPTVSGDYQPPKAPRHSDVHARKAMDTHYQDLKKDMDRRSSLIRDASMQVGSRDASEITAQINRIAYSMAAALLVFFAQESNQRYLVDELAQDSQLLTEYRKIVNEVKTRAQTSGHTDLIAAIDNYLLNHLLSGHGRYPIKEGYDGERRRIGAIRELVRLRKWLKENVQRANPPPDPPRPPPGSGGPSGGGPPPPPPAPGAPGAAAGPSNPVVWV